MTDERMAEQVKAADAALRETLTRLLRDDGVTPVSVVIVLAQLVGEIAVDDAATNHGVHDADTALRPVLKHVRRAGHRRAETATSRKGRAAGARVVLAESGYSSAAPNVYLLPSLDHLSRDGEADQRQLDVIPRHAGRSAPR